MKQFMVAPSTSEDYRLLARQRLPRFLYEYIEGGSFAEETLSRNRADFADFALRQRVLRDVSAVDTKAIFLKQGATMPVALAPVGLAGMMARRGEVLGAKAAKKAGIPFTVSTLGICSVEEVMEAVEEPVWFQLYMFREREVVTTLLDRVWKAGVSTLVFTVDLAAVGLRHSAIRNGMNATSLWGRLAKSIQLGTRPSWLWDVGLLGRPHGIGNLADFVPDPSDFNAFNTFLRSQFDPTVTWQDIKWLRDIWKGKLLIKGVLDEGDAEDAVTSGADGIIVSNHGGRQLDGVQSSVSKLPSIVSTVGGKIDVFLDGGVRNGIDVVKALALGADGVFMGRPWVWAVAGSGEHGLQNFLATIKMEISSAMALMGVTTINAIRGEHLEYRTPIEIGQKHLELL